MQSKERKDKMEKKKYIIITLCSIFVLILGVTVAWLSWDSEENIDVSFTIGEDILITYDAGEDITGRNIRPVSSLEYGVENNYAIEKTITVSSKKTNFYFKLFLTAEVLPEGLSHESFKWELHDNDTDTLINSGDFSNVSQGDKITLLSVSEITTIGKNMTLYIWMDGNMDNPVEMAGQDYKFVLSATASDNESFANAPELVEGMVPVEYKTTSDGVEADGWYVADINSNWYDYSEKQWANAVLVTDESGLRGAIAGTPVSDSNDNSYFAA